MRKTKDGSSIQTKQKQQTQHSCINDSFIINHRDSSSIIMSRKPQHEVDFNDLRCPLTSSHFSKIMCDKKKEKTKENIITTTNNNKTIIQYSIFILYLHTLYTKQ